MGLFLSRYFPYFKEGRTLWFWVLPTSCDLSSKFLFFSAVGPPGPPGKYPFCIFLVQGQLWGPRIQGPQVVEGRSRAAPYPCPHPFLWAVSVASGNRITCSEAVLNCSCSLHRTSGSWWVTRTQWIRWTAWSPGTKRRKRSKREERKNG